MLDFMPRAQIVVNELVFELPKMILLIQSRLSSFWGKLGIFIRRNLDCRHDMGLGILAWKVVYKYYLTAISYFTYLKTRLKGKMGQPVYF